MEVGDNEADLQSDTARICHSPFGLLVLLCGEHLRTNLGTHSILKRLKSPGPFQHCPGLREERPSWECSRSSLRMECGRMQGFL